MSGVLGVTDELHNYGLSSGPDKDVCIKHCTDSAIRSFIRTNGITGKCDYCKRAKKVVPLEDLNYC